MSPEDPWFFTEVFSMLITSENLYSSFHLFSLALIFNEFTKLSCANPEAALTINDEATRKGLIGNDNIDLFFGLFNMSGGKNSKCYNATAILTTF